MAYEHRKWDKEFAEQWDEAIETALDLLHARVFQRCLEGDLEPVFHMGVVVGWIRKFDTKLQIEMLRAYRRERFKTPGAHINVGVKSDVFVLTEEQRHILMDLNREWILDQPLPAEESPAPPVIGSGLDRDAEIQSGAAVSPAPPPQLGDN